MEKVDPIAMLNALLRARDASIELLKTERDALANDCQILLAQIDFLCEASGESLDREDADLVAAIRGRFQKSS